MNKQLNLFALSGFGYIGLMTIIPLIQAFAQDASAILNVTTTVDTACSITESSVTLPFGTYDPNSGSPDDNNVAFNVTCSNGEAYYISLDKGASFIGSPPDQRRMANGASSAFIEYDLFQDSYTTKWGDGTVLGNYKTVSSATGSEESHTIYGRIPINQYVAADSYSDYVNIDVYLGTPS